MSDIYSSYLSESTQKKKNIYASWPKEKNTWRKNTLPAPLVPAPPVNRHNKPDIIIFKEGIVEEAY